MTSKQRAYLRKMAQELSPIFQVGKGGISDNMIVQIGEALEARELIKITVLNNASEDVKEVGNEIAARTDSALVQTVGHKITLYRQSEKNPVIVL